MSAANLRADVSFDAPWVGNSLRHHHSVAGMIHPQAHRLGPAEHLSQQTWLTYHHYSNLELKENTTVVVLGASGDLAKKKTVSLKF